jgi:hypothetical protein
MAQEKCIGTICGGIPIAGEVFWIDTLTGGVSVKAPYCGKDAYNKTAPQFEQGLREARVMINTFGALINFSDLGQMPKELPHGDRLRQVNSLAAADSGVTGRFMAVRATIKRQQPFQALGLLSSINGELRYRLASRLEEAIDRMMPHVVSHRQVEVAQLLQHARGLLQDARERRERMEEHRAKGTIVDRDTRAGFMRSTKSAANEMRSVFISITNSFRNEERAREAKLEEGDRDLIRVIQGFDPAVMEETQEEKEVAATKGAEVVDETPKARKPRVRPSRESEEDDEASTATQTEEQRDDAQASTSVRSFGESSDESSLAAQLKAATENGTLKVKDEEKPRRVRAKSKQ